MKAKIFILLVVISVKGFCQSNSNEDYRSARINTILAPATDIISISDNYFLFGFSKELRKGVFILSIEKINKKGQLIKDINREYLLNSNQTEKISNLLNSISFDNFVTDSLIDGYNYGWTDCPSTTIIWNNKLFNYPCLIQQTVASMEPVKSLVKNILEIIDLNSTRNNFHNSLPKGNYRTGMILITKT